MRMCLVATLSLSIVSLTPAAAAAGAAAGELDSKFGTGGGTATASFDASMSIGSAMAVQPDKRIVVGGRAGDTTTGDFAVARFAADGATLDTSFGGDGKVTTEFSPAHDVVRDIVVQSDGTIVAAGLANSEPTGDFALARYLPDGSLDGTFGRDGTVTTDLSGVGDGIRGIVVQLDGKIVAAGAAGGDSALVRYLPDGTLDAGFGLCEPGVPDGIVVDDLGGPDHFFNIALQNDGSVVVVGTAHGDFLIARYTSDGCPDLTFGTGGSGRTTTDLFGRNDLAFDLAIRPDGAIVVGGEEGAVDAFGITTSAFAVAQYRADGKLDSTFAGRGFTTTDIVPGSADGIRGMELQGTSVLAVGFAGERHGLTSFLDPTEGDFALARYTSTGDLDTTFGSGDGVVTTDFSGQGDGIRAVVVVAGKVVVAGGANGPVDLDIALARYLL